MIDIILICSAMCPIFSLMLIKAERDADIEYMDDSMDYLDEASYH